jgi:hypothetical protein
MAAQKTREAENSVCLPTNIGAIRSHPVPATASAQTSAPVTGSMQIENVFGVGDLNTEVILLKHTGSGELWLTVGN